MAPAIKRRKLQHDDSEASDGSAKDSATTQRKEGTLPKTSAVANPHRRPDAQLQDGAYTSESFKSNVFKLQIDELLEQVTPKYGKREAPAENAMRVLKSVIEELPSRSPLSVAAAEKLLRVDGVTIPFPSPHPPKDAQYKLQYERPSSINATGSYPLKIATRSDSGLAIDLVVAMPAAIFQEKDYLNHRYFYKRAYYLACLAAGLKESQEHSFLLSFENLHGNQLQPIIVVRPSGSGPADFSSSKCRINILLTAPDSLFPRQKLSPGSNCVRPKADDANSEGKPLVPTPLYNNTLLSDVSVTSYLKLLHTTAAKCDAFKEACILGRVWMQQRGFGSSLRKGGFGNFEWAAVSALLLQPTNSSRPPPLSPGYSSYQLFKATLQFLARHDLLTKPYTIQAAHDVPLSKSGFAPVFFDGFRSMNILFKMTPWSYARLQLEAKTTVDMLGDSLFDQFDSTFILKADLSKYRYDSTLELPLSTFELDTNSEEYDEKLSGLCNKIYNTLIRALTNRVTIITLSVPENSAWPTGSAKVPESQQKRILIRFAIDPAHAYRTVDYGPAAENKQEAASFRKFWGDKAELRRFKDGSILESVVWSNKDTSAPILEQIALYILDRHVNGTVASNAKFTSDSFAGLVPSGGVQSSSGIAPFTVAMNTFATIEKDIRELEGLPLQIRHIRAADEQLRYASIEPPLDRPASIVLQFEASARWPDDLCAIQRTKIAFLIKLSELLSAARPGLVTRVGLENPSQPSQNQGYLDIAVAAKCTFRLRIHHDREATLLERQLKDKSLDAQSRESAATALALYKRDFIQSVSHTQAIQNLCTRYPAFSPAIRLTKKWFAAHFLLPHFAPEFIELLVARTFLQPHPWPTPSCATTAFLRTLTWIGRWDWRFVPLIVDFSSTVSSNAADPDSARLGRMLPEDMEKMQTRFEAWRKIDLAMNRVVLFAATNLDPEGNTWSDRGRPEKVVASRMTSLAKAATMAMREDEEQMLAAANGVSDAEYSFTPESLFAAETQAYDIVLHTSPKYTTAKTSSKSKPKFKNLEVQQLAPTTRPEAMLMPLFIEDLHTVFGDAILWFWNPESLDRVAGLWNPTVTGQRAFKVKSGWNSLPVANASRDSEEKSEQSVDIQINKGAMIHDMKRLAGELITKIEVKS